MLVGQALRLLVGAFDEADPGAEIQHPRQVLFRPVQRRLQDDAHLVVAVAPQRFEDVERHFGIGRALHVDADEEPRRVGPIEDFPQVVHRAGAVHVEAELRELERNVAADAGRDDRFADLAVLARRRIRLREAGDAFAEVVERVQQAACLHRAGRLDRLGRRLAGDEAAREARRPPHPVARRQLLQDGCYARGDEKKPWLRRRALMRPAGGGEEVLDGSRVVPQHAAVAHAEPSAFEHHDAARFEQLAGLVDRLPAARHAEVRLADGELVDAR